MNIIFLFSKKVICIVLPILHIERIRHAVSSPQSPSKAAKLSSVNKQPCDLSILTPKVRNDFSPVSYWKIP